MLKELLGRVGGKAVDRIMERRLRCSFCRRYAVDVARLVVGASAYICDECVAKCVAVLESHGGVAPTGTNH